MSDATLLVPIEAHGPLAGFRNMLDKELGTWWRRPRWLLHLVLWVTVINGFLLLVQSGDATGPDGATAAMDAAGKLAAMLEVFFRVGGFFATIGVVTAAQDVMLKERQMGTAAWVLTKPLARTSFVLAKLLATAVAVVVLMTLVPAVVFLLQARLGLGQGLEMTRFVPAVGLLLVSHLFYLALTLCLGTVFNARGAVTGSAIGFLFAGQIVGALRPELNHIFPWMVHGFGAALAQGAPRPEWWWQPVAATVGWTVGLVALAAWRFEREEF